jgi:hypothetical protein
MGDELQPQPLGFGDFVFERPDAAVVLALPRIRQTRARGCDVADKGLQLHPLERTHRNALVRARQGDGSRPDAPSSVRIMLVRA